MADWYLNLPKNDVTKAIKNCINDASRSFVAIGFYLKQVRDRKLYEEDGYQTLAEYAQAEFGISNSSVSRFMAINDRFSVDGNSPILLEQYKDFSSSKLSEMLTLTDKQLEQVTPATTVKEIREMKPSKLKKEPDPVVKSKDVNQDEILQMLSDSICKMHAERLGKEYYSANSIIEAINCSHSFGFGDDGYHHSLYIAEFNSICVYIKAFDEDNTVICDFPIMAVEQYIYSNQGKEHWKQSVVNREQQRKTDWQGGIFEDDGFEYDSTRYEVVQYSFAALHELKKSTLTGTIHFFRSGLEYAVSQKGEYIEFMLLGRVDFKVDVSRYYKELEQYVKESVATSQEELALQPLGLPAATIKKLGNAGIHTVDELNGKSRGDLAKIRNFGKKDMDAVEKAIVPEQKPEKEYRVYDCAELFISKLDDLQLITIRTGSETAVMQMLKTDFCDRTYNLDNLIKFLTEREESLNHGTTVRNSVELCGGKYKYNLSQFARILINVAPEKQELPEDTLHNLILKVIERKKQEVIAALQLGNVEASKQIAHILFDQSYRETEDTEIHFARFSGCSYAIRGEKKLASWQRFVEELRNVLNVPETVSEQQENVQQESENVSQVVADVEYKEVRPKRMDFCEFASKDIPQHKQVEDIVWDKMMNVKTESFSQLRDIITDGVCAWLIGMSYDYERYLKSLN